MRKMILTGTALMVTFAAAAHAGADGKPTYGRWGLDMTNIDAAVKPGDDFFRYVGRGRSGCI